jgi:hypothetical protein
MICISLVRVNFPAERRHSAIPIVAQGARPAGRAGFAQADDFVAEGADAARANRDHGLPRVNALEISRHVERSDAYL